MELEITKKLAGEAEGSASWMTNVGNERGEVLNSVLTVGDGAGLDWLCQGIVRRYEQAGEAQPEVIYVDKQCCVESGVPPALSWFHPWTSPIRLDSFHILS